MKRVLAILLLCCAAAPTPEEVEARTASVSETLRCVVCKNQSIMDSDAALAEAMRDLVRARIEAGDTDDEVRAHLVARYGEFVLLKPKASARNLWLWAAPFAVLLAGGAGAALFVRGAGGNRGQGGAAPLTDEERAELARLRG